jgi:hypothetical protein
MPEWITVYCQKVGDEITADSMRQGIVDADFYTLAEDYDVDDSRVKPALTQLKIESNEDGFKISYQKPEVRPIQVHRWTDTERVEEELEEARERLEDQPLSDTVNTHLEGVKEVIGIELGFSQMNDMGIVFADVVARWLATSLVGLVEMPDERWYAIGEHGEFKPL